MDIDNIVMWVILQNSADWDCFKTPISREILQIQKPLLEEHCAFLEAIRLFQSVEKQTSVSHSSTDAGLRFDGIPALDLWDLIVSVLGNTTQTTEGNLSFAVTRITCATDLEE